MLRRTLNLGILAHVDAGKTTLTERLLYEAGAIDVLGSIDAGTTQTDTLELERERGITIRAAVASFRVGELDVNLIDTPGATLARDFGLEVGFREARAVYVERPSRVGEAVELLHAPTNPFNASIGIRVEPDHGEQGVSFRLDVDPRTIPLDVYKTVDSFRAHMARYVRDALAEGIHGWQVVGCAVTMTRCLYCLADGPPSKRGPTSTAADFRRRTSSSACSPA